MESDQSLNKWNILETLYLFGCFALSIYFGVTILFLVGHRNEGLSQWYILLYGLGAWFCVLYFGITMVLSILRIPSWNYLDFGLVAERHNYRFLSSVSSFFGRPNFIIDSIFRIGPHLIFIVMILLWTGAFGAVGYPIPNPYDLGGFTINQANMSAQMAYVQQTYSVSPLKQAYFISVPVGFIEEAVVLMLIEATVLIFIIAWILGSWLVTRQKQRVPAAVHIVFIIIATFICSLGYSAIVPGFVDAHSAAYGADSAAFYTAFVFEFTGQLLNQFTGLFLSWIPHMLHNFIVSYLSIAGLAIGVTVAGLVFIRKKRTEANHYD